MKECLKQKLLQLNFVNDGEWLDKYVELIFLNKNTTYEKSITQRHHIVPVFYFKSNNLEVDNSINNLVNLKYTDHVLAHYYLALCSKDKYVYQATMPLVLILGAKNYPCEECSLLNRLPYLQNLYERSRINTKNPMFVQKYKELHDEKMRTKEIRDKISQTMRAKIASNELFDDEHRKHLSESATGRISIHKDGLEKHVKPSEIEQYLKEGWVHGGLPATLERIECLAASRRKRVQCVDVNNNVLGEFNSVKDACLWWADGKYTKKLPKNVFELSNTIKKSSKYNVYICGVKWVYLDK